MEVMYLDEMHWKDRNHRSSFLPSYQMVEDHFETLISYDIVTTPQSSILIYDVEFEVNMSNIMKIIPFNISMKPGVGENIHLGQNCSSL